MRKTKTLKASGDYDPDAVAVLKKVRRSLKSSITQATNSAAACEAAALHVHPPAQAAFYREQAAELKAIARAFSEQFVKLEKIIEEIKDT
jgi:hypothetical protein